MAFKKFGKGEVVAPTEDERLGIEYEAMKAEETEEDRKVREAIRKRQRVRKED